MAHKPSPPSMAWAYLAAALLGAWFVAAQLSWPAILGTGGVWRFPAGDLAQNLAGHLAFQATPWGWPLLRAANLDAPAGLSIAMTDSNPLVSLLAKLFTRGLGLAPHNFLGLWCALCFFLQPVSAVYAARGLGVRRVETAIAAAVFAVCAPAFLARYGHVNLLGHFFLLLALGVALRDARQVAAPGFAARYALLLGAVLCHPYLFFFASLLLSTGFWSAVFRRTAWRTALGIYLALVLAVLLTDYALSGTFGQGATGFGYYSMNLLAPVWPHGSWFFPQLPQMDATGGQYEGYNYLGAGAILAVLLALPRLGPVQWRDWRGLIFVLSCLTLLALSTRIYAGHSLVLSLGLQPWRQIFGWVQSSGRAFWVVGYFVTLAGLAATERLQRLAGLALLAGVTGLQMLDVSPLRQQEAFAFSTAAPQVAPIAAIAPATKLFTVAPACSADADGQAGALILAAARQGVALSHIRAARDPGAFNCEIGASDAAELPIGPGELRAFRQDGSMPPLRASVFAAGALCRRASGFLLCRLGETGGELPAAVALPVETLPARLAGADIPAGFGWVADAGGAYWSEGPRATLLFKLGPAAPDSGTLDMVLDLRGVAMHAGGSRAVRVSATGAAPFTVELGDGQREIVPLQLQLADIAAAGYVRVTLDFYHPVAPPKRQLTAPVQRAAVVLYGVGLSAAP